MYASGTILGTQDKVVNKTDKNSALTEHEDTKQLHDKNFFKLKKEIIC